MNIGDDWGPSFINYWRRKWVLHLNPVKYLSRSSWSMIFCIIMKIWLHFINIVDGYLFSRNPTTQSKSPSLSIQFGCFICNWLTVVHHQRYNGFHIRPQSPYLGKRRYQRNIQHRPRIWRCDEAGDLACGDDSPFGGFTHLDAVVATRRSEIPGPSKYLPRDPLSLNIWFFPCRSTIWHVARVWMKYWNKLQDQIRDGTAPECFVKQLAESNYQEKGISEIQAAYLSGCTHSLSLSSYSLLFFSFSIPQSSWLSFCLFV